MLNNRYLEVNALNVVFILCRLVVILAFLSVLSM